MSLQKDRDVWVERLREKLGQAVRTSKRRQRELEESNGFQRGYLSQVLHGHIQLTVRHVFGILLALDIEPADFFGELFGHSEISQRIYRYDYGFKELEGRGLISPVSVVREAWEKQAGDPQGSTAKPDPDGLAADEEGSLPDEETASDDPPRQR